MVGFNFAPAGWAFCDGQILPINQNQSLYSLLGTNYGGDGETSFALPDLRGRTPVHEASNHPLGQKGGEESHTLSAGEMPQHAHVPRAATGTLANPSPIPSNKLLADSAPNEIYRSPDSLVPTRSDTVASVGAGQAHNNMQPYLAVNFCIALRGLFPSHN
nr:tail fiber protein [Lysobacter sp. CAU 1642]